jgi:UDP-hydrolysing UDP-N-acetyl-D-glucosamine 2-epimerase
MKVLSVSSGRADVGILEPVWRALAMHVNLELHVLLTGAHVSDDTAARNAMPSSAVAYTGGSDIAGRDSAAAATAMTHIAEVTARLAARISPNRALVVGDRLDMLPAVIALVPLNVPIVHLHGGELTLGAIDDRVRHAITKLSHLHCASTVDAAERIAHMGEEPWRIRVTGAPGLDTLVEAPAMDRETFSRDVGLRSLDRLRLVTVHPETNAADPLAAVCATLAALDATPGPSLITAPNADPGGVEARKRIGEFVARHDCAVFRESLGATLYANALRHASVMVGNSSSGLIEAGLFGLPVINVGQRQDGRLRGPNVRDCVAEVTAITHLLRDAPSRFPQLSPYGDGHAASRVAAVVAELHDQTRLLYKTFATDNARFSAPWDSALGARKQRKHA